MHIVFLTHEYPKEGFPHGGVGIFVQTLARNLVLSGIKVSVVGINYTDKAEEYQDQGVCIYRLKRKRMVGFTWYLYANEVNHKLRNIHKQNRIDIVEGTEASLAFLNKIHGVKFLIRLHGGHHYFAETEQRPINWRKAWLEKRSFRKADAIIGVSQYVMDYTSKYISFEEKKRGVIFNPANLEQFSPKAETNIVPGRIFFAGTVCEKKGIRQLIQAFPLIKKSVPYAHLVIAGRDWYFPKTGQSYIAYLKQWIDLNLKEDIHFLGAIPNEDIPEQIALSEVCCYPSHMEAMPLAWIEVMSMGKAFVASLLGPGPEIVSHEKNGLLCNPLSPEDIAKKVIYMLTHKDEAKQMGIKAREFALANFSLDTIGSKNIALYQSLL
jgi:glycosyltransferase involved in cell wall biosynthesis